MKFITAGAGEIGLARRDASNIVNAMFRHARAHLWQFGVSGLPAFWPFPHFKLNRVCSSLNRAHSTQVVSDA